MSNEQASAQEQYVQLQRKTYSEEPFLNDCVKESLISASTIYDAPQEIIWVNDAPIATLGNFSVTTGKAKSRKTFNVSALVAAALSNSTVIGYRAKLPENKRCILYIDTEQSPYHCHKVLNRILTMAGKPTGVECENLIFRCFRKYDPKLRLELVEYAIEEYKDRIGLLVIDGIRDLMLDINDSTESVLLVNHLMRWSATFNIHIHVALHLNKSDDNVRGHIGTETNNKAEAVLLVAKDRYDNNMSEVSPLYLRYKEFKPFQFQIDENGIPENVYGYRQPGEKKEKPISFSDLTEEQHKQALGEVFKGGTVKGRNKTAEALKNAYSSVGFQRGLTTFCKILEHLVRKGTITLQNKNHYSLSSANHSLH